MLVPVEIIPSARSLVRRAVSLEAHVVSRAWEGMRKHRVLDLSPDGMRVAAGTRLEVDEPVVVTFEPPGWWLFGELTLFAKVARTTPRDTAFPASMGLRFLDLPRGARGELQRTLRGLPPPIPRKKRRAERELVWVDTLVTYTEDLGDRVNTFEVSEALGSIDLDDVVLEPLSELLTGGDETWVHAA